ncbi:hypothetical protein TWF217_007299 [Orbilia oligospora]|nr:hypothetical protein TWF128_001319 [Orbilia oligospora]KAF3253827.1 hypothetical protein TWF217_007299 [Orbilia oligospora]
MDRSCLGTEKKKQNTNEEAKINVIQQWPAGSRTSDKVPTEFVYTEDGSWETLKWGFQAQAPDLSPRVIRWTKLLLDPDYTNLRSKLKYILTVPAIWSEKAKETHLEAAGKAGYGSKEELDLISEPQAASIAAFRSLGHGPLCRYDCFTVVDCGGGTVRDDMRNIFDPTIDSIVALISAQIKSAAVAAQRVKMILLVGGFGGSPYLRRRVQEWVDKEKYTIEVAQPPDAWTSIARGAVMHGIESHTIKDRIARTSYGVYVDVRFNEGIHPKYHVDNYHEEYDGILRVRDQMEWFIKKGVRINGIKSVFRVTYCQHLETEEFADPGDLKITDALYAYNGDDTPAKPSDYGVRPLCDLETDLNSILKEKWKVRNKTDGTSYFMVEFDFVMEVEGEKLLFGLEIDGVKYSGVSATFH